MAKKKEKLDIRYKSPGFNEVVKKKVKPKTPLTKKKIDYMKMWDGMPEYVQESAQPIQKIIVGFATQEDILRFAKLVGQPITPKTRSIWYPPLVNKPIYNKRWSDKKTKRAKK